MVAAVDRCHEFVWRSEKDIDVALEADDLTLCLVKCGALSYVITVHQKSIHKTELLFVKGMKIYPR